MGMLPKDNGSNEGAVLLSSSLRAKEVGRKRTAGADVGRDWAVHYHACQFRALMLQLVGAGAGDPYQSILHVHGKGFPVDTHALGMTPYHSCVDD